MNENSCLHYLLPKLKDRTIANKLRNGPLYNNVTARTTISKKSFILYGLITIIDFIYLLLYCIFLNSCFLYFVL
jgi:hypothetical protein